MDMIDRNHGPTHVVSFGCKPYELGPGKSTTGTTSAEDGSNASMERQKDLVLLREFAQGFPRNSLGQVMLYSVALGHFMLFSVLVRSAKSY